MKLLKLTTAYPRYIQTFYARRPGLAEQPYARQQAAFDYDAFGWADFWSHALAAHGYEARDLTANVPPLQKAWARERGIPAETPGWLLAIAAAQVREFRPDVLFLDDYSTFTYEWITELRAGCPSLRLVLGWCGAPYADPAVFRAYDLVLSCIPELVEEFRRLGHTAAHLHHAFEPRLLERLPADPGPPIAVSFVGQIVRHHNYHTARERLLVRLVRDCPVEIYSPAGEAGYGADLKARARQGLYDAAHVLQALGVPGRVVRRLPGLGKGLRYPTRPPRAHMGALQPYLRPGVFGLEMYSTLRRSQVTLNSHIDASRRSASNMRLFEATGAGTCLVTDWKENLATLFEPDREVVAYRSAEECLEKVRWLLAHPAERAAIAAAGQVRTLREHTFAQRVTPLDALIRAQLAGARDGAARRRKGLDLRS